MVYSNFEFLRIERAERAISERAREQERFAQHLKSEYLNHRNLEKKEHESFKAIHSQLKQDAASSIDVRQKYNLVRLRNRYLSESRARSRRLKSEIVGLTKKGQQVGQEISLLRKRAEALSERKVNLKEKAQSQREDSLQEEQITVKYFSEYSQKLGSTRAGADVGADRESPSVTRRETFRDAEELVGNSFGRFAESGPSEPFLVQDSSAQSCSTSLPLYEFQGEREAFGFDSECSQDREYGEEKVEGLDCLTDIGVEKLESEVFGGVDEALDSSVLPESPEGDVADVQEEEWRTVYNSAASESSRLETESNQRDSEDSQVEQLELFRDARGQGLNLQYRLKGSSLVRVHILRGMNGELDLTLRPNNQVNRSELLAAKSEILRNLQQSGLCIRSLTIQKGEIG